MKSSSKVSTNPPLHDRCHHLSPAGRRCSQPACSSHPTLCFTHAPKPPSPEVAVAAELFEAAGSLETPEDVNHLLTKTVLAFIAGRLPLKKAGMIGFLGRIILRTHREIAFHQQVERKLHPRTIIHDLPRPDRSEVFQHPSEPLLPPHGEDIFAPANVAPAAPTATAAQITATPQTQPINTLPPTPPPTPDAPEKIPDLSHFYPNDPTLDPRFHTYNLIPYIPAERLDDPVWPGDPPRDTRPVYRKFALRRKHC